MKLDSLLGKLAGTLGRRAGAQADGVQPPKLSGAVRVPYGPFQFKVQLPRGVPYELQASTDLGHWVTLAQGTATAEVLEYVDSEAFKFSYRFYRAVAGGLRSAEILGYAVITLPPGFSLIANPLRAPSNGVGDMFSGWPDGTTLHKFDTRLFRLTENAVRNGKWSNPAEPFVPGEGAIFFNPTQDYRHQTFVGEVLQGNLSMPIPAGFSLRGSLVPQPGQLREDLHFPVAEGDVIHLFDRDRQQYVLYPWSQGKWQSGVPVLSVGEAFWVAKTSPANWTRSFFAGD